MMMRVCQEMEGLPNVLGICGGVAFPGGRFRHRNSMMMRVCHQLHHNGTYPQEVLRCQ